MIFGLDESDGRTLPEARDNDLKLIQELASEIGVRDVEISDCFCLGKRGEKPRPIKVRCRIPYQRDELLRRAPRIKHLNSALGFQKTFIKPDLSPKEREANRQLRQEFLRRREAGDSVMIRGGHVVKKHDIISNIQD